MLSRRHKRFLALSLLLLPGVVLGDSGDEPPSVQYRSSTSEVRVTFFATDDNNHPVGVVRQDDFVIVDDGMVIRNFRSLMRSDETGLDVVVMVDASESVASRFQPVMKDVLQLVSQTQVAADDNVSVVSFAGLQSVVLCTRDCRSAMAGQKLLSVRAVGATPLFDALAYSADFVSSRHSPGVKPVLILFSDGDDTISRISAQEALQAVVASGALLYTVDMNQPGRGGRGGAALQRMAEATGGRYFPAREGAVNVLSAALEDLRASYVVTYQLPSRAVGFHSLNILPKHNLTLRFHCRSGYYYGQNAP